MPPKMMIEIPLPIPYWVISSPIQINSTVPAVIVMMIASVPSGFTPKPKSLMIGCGALALSRFGVPQAWRAASGTVSQCVYWLILLRPDSPSLVSSVSCGMIGTRSCMMIEAVMYGYTPIAAMEKVDIAPPLNRSSSPTSWLVWNRRVSASASAPGTGTWAMKRNTASKNAVNSSFRRRSGSCQALTRALISSKQFHLSPRGFDLLARGGGEAIGAHRQRDTNLAVAEDLVALALRIDQPGREQLRRADLAGEARQVPQVHRLVLHPEGVGEAAAIGQPLHQGKLAAFEIRRNTAAGAGLLPLGSPASRLAATRAMATADPPPFPPGSSRRA